MKTMKALRMYGINDLRLENVPVPEIGPGEILVKVKAAAICGTDIRMIYNGAANINEEHPLILGHEIAGTVAKVGKGVTSYTKGQRVTIAPNFGCGVCDRCVSGRSHLCPDYQALGIQMDGGFAEYVKVPAMAVAAGNVTLIPEKVSFKEAAVNEPLSCAFNGSERCNIKPGDVVVIIGAGPIGTMHAMLAKMAGAGKVIVSDLSAERLAVTKKVDSSFITTTEKIEDFVKEITNGRGADVCITACPAPAAQQSAMEICGLDGRINFFGGIPASKEPIAINTNLVHYKQLIISGTTRSSLAQFRKTLTFIENGILPVKNIITNTYSIDDWQTAILNAKNAVGMKHVIVF